MTAIQQLTLDELNAGVDEIRNSPADAGVIEMIVRRPDLEQRDVVQQAELDLNLGMIGDNWATRGSSSTPDGSSHPNKQITLMNVRAVSLLAQERENWPIAGDQFYVDMDLSTANLPPGTLLGIGSAVIRVSEERHTGCAKFSARFGSDAMKFVNSPVGRSLQLRGINAKVMQAGVVQVGDVVKKL
jgi:hypothetical protein